MDLSPAFACDCTNIYVASEHNVGICGYVQAREGRVDERYWLRPRSGRERRKSNDCGAHNQAAAVSGREKTSSTIIHFSPQPSCSNIYSMAKKAALNFSAELDEEGAMQKSGNQFYYVSLV
jgi:hypothetical protein